MPFCQKFNEHKEAQINTTLKHIIIYLIKTSAKEENFRDLEGKKKTHIQENKKEIYSRIFVRSSTSQKIKE